MALTVGEIQGVISIDDSGVDSGLASSESKFKAFAKKAVVIGAAVGTALAAGTVEAMNVEAGTDKLAAQLGLTESESARIGKVAGSLYANAYGGSLEEVNTAVGAVVSSIKGMRNASSAEVEAMSAKALDLATAFEIDVARAAQVAGQMLTSGIAKDGTHAMDLLVASMQRVPTAVREDLLDAVDEYGPFMESIGIKGEQAMGLLVKGAEKGMYGIDKTGDALKEFTIRATDMSTASKVGYDAIGMSQEAMTKKLLAGGDTARGAFNKIITGLRNIKDPAKQSQAALALFGTPMEDLNVSEIPKFLASLSGAEAGLGKVGGAADRMGKTLNDNASTNLTAFGRQAKTAFVTIVGGMVLPIVNETAAFLATNFGPALKLVGSVLTSTVLPALQEFGQFVAENQTPIKIIAALIAAVFIPHLIALGLRAIATKVQVVGAWVVMKAQAIAGAAAHSVAIVGMVAKWGLLAAQAVLHAGSVAGAWLLTAGANAATALGSMIAASAVFVAKWAWVGAQSLLHAAKVAAAWLIAMGPVGWVIAAVVGLVALIIAKWDAIKAYTVRVWNMLVGFVKGVWEKIKSFATSLWNGLAGFFQGVVNRIVGFFQAIGRLPGQIAGWFGRLKDAAVAKMVELVNWVKGLPSRILNAVGNLGNLLVNAGKSILEGLWNGLKSMGSWLKSKLIGLVRDIIPGPVADALGISSPSKVMADIARWIPVGMAQGIDSTAGQVTAATERLAARVSGGISTGVPSIPARFVRGSDGVVTGGPQSSTSGGARDIHVEHLEVKAYSDRFSLSQVRSELALNGVA